MNTFKKPFTEISKNLFWILNFIKMKNKSLSNLHCIKKNCLLTNRKVIKNQEAQFKSCIFFIFIMEFKQNSI